MLMSVFAKFVVLLVYCMNIDVHLIEAEGG